MSAYEIIVAKNGLKLTAVEQKPDDSKASAAGPPPPLGKDGLPPPPAPGQSYVFRTTTGFLLRGVAIPLSDLAAGLSWQLSRPVVDHTDLPKTALYDVRLEWGDNGPAPDSFSRETPSSANDPNGPSIFTAIQDQLGLRLVSTKAGVDVIVIDGIEKPKS